MRPFWRSSQGKQPSRQNASLVRDALVAIARMVLRRVSSKGLSRLAVKALVLRSALRFLTPVLFIGVLTARTARMVRRIRTRRSNPPPTPSCSGCETSRCDCKKKGGKGFARQTPSALKSAAYLIARAIKRNGVPGVKYWTEAYDTMWPRYAQKIAEAKVEDVALQLEAVIGGITIKAK